MKTGTWLDKGKKHFREKYENNFGNIPYLHRGLGYTTNSTYNLFNILLYINWTDIELLLMMLKLKYLASVLMSATYFEVHVIIRWNKRQKDG